MAPRPPALEPTVTQTSDTEATDFSLVRNDALLRAQRAIGLVPREGLGVGRRALILAGITWLPIAVWALWQGRAISGSVDEPLLNHFGIHVRALLAIPLLVLAEGVSHGVTTRLMPQFLRSGLVPDSERAKFLAVLRAARRLSEQTLPWVVVAGIVVAVTLVAPGPAANHELIWAGDPQHVAGFGAFWFSWVLRPIFTALLVVWLWRLFLAFLTCARLARLDLRLVPTHPDGAGGLGFLEALPIAFSPVVLAVSVVLASRWSHDVLYHGVHVNELRMPMIAMGVVLALLFLSPLRPWRKALMGAKRNAELEYGALVAEHGRLVRRRWILGEDVGDAPVLSAPELGPVADTITLYEATRKMRAVPIGRRSLFAVLLPAALPQVVVLAIEIPIKDLLLGLLKTLT
jgi:hypothetical protein